MVDESIYRRIQAEINRLPCVFKSALLSLQAVCELAVRHSVAEREVLSCSQAPAHLNCITLERLFLERATFPLKLHPGAPHTHGTVMRLHRGGLRGLQQVLNAPQPDVHQMVVQAQREHSSLMQLPWEPIVAQIIATEPRRRASTPEA